MNVDLAPAVRPTVYCVLRLVEDANKQYTTCKMTQYSRVWVLTQFLTYQLVLKDQEAAPGTSLAVQWLGLSPQNIGGIGSIPVQGSKICTILFQNKLSVSWEVDG